MTVVETAPTSPLSTRRLVVVVAAVFALLLGVLATWVVAIPRFAVPDEPAHWYKAYGTAHGQGIGEVDDRFPDNIRAYDAPYEMGITDLRCYFGLPDIPASCANAITDKAISTAALAPPFWYAIVGGAARLLGVDTSQRAYRLIGAAICAGLIAVAFGVAAASRVRHVMPLLLVGLTPMTLFVSAGVNPNGFEITAFMLAWSLLLLVQPSTRPSALAGAAVGALAGAAIVSRFAASIWVMSGAIVVCALLGARGLRRFATARFLLPAAALVGLAVGALLWWSRSVGFEVRDDAVASDWSTGRVISYTVGALPEITQQMAGVLGWLDTELPLLAYLAVAAGALVGLVGIVASRDRHLIAATSVLILLLCIVPVLVNVITAPTAGLVWQGRYSLSLFVGFTVLGMLGWDRYVAASGRYDRARLAAVAASATFVIAEVLAFWQMLRRFTVGASGKIWLVEPLPWSPSVAPMTLIAANALLALSLVVVLLRVSTTPPLDPAEYPSPA